MRILQLLLATLLSLVILFALAGTPALAENESPDDEASLSQEQLSSSESGEVSEEAEGGVQKKTITGPSQEKVEVTLRRELAYGLTLFDGGQYQGSFCPEEIDTIYMVANVDNVITAHRTDVYFWPITKEYMADWMGVNEKQKGSLEVLKGNEVIKELSLEKYALRYPDGYLGNATELKVGKEAEEVAEAYKAKMDAYYDAVMKYYRDYDEYNKLVEKFLKDPKAFDNKPPKEPEQPKPPREYVMDVDEGFLLNLSPGNYRIRFKDEKGEVVPKSEKRLVVFPVLAKGIGYEIIPEEKWTYPTKSDDLSENIFALKNRVIYLKPFDELQYNAHHYTKLTQLPSPSSGRGMENQKLWVHVAPLTGEKVFIEIVKDGKVVSRIEEKPYYVKQRPGYALGYDIVEFNEEEFPGSSPSFTAYRIEMPKDVGRYYLRLVDENGKLLEGSLRNLRTIRQPELLTLLLVSLFPFVVGVVVVGVRSLTTRRLSPKIEGQARSTIQV